MSKCGRKVEPPVLFCCNPLQAQADDNNACFWKWRNRTTGGKKNIFHLFFWLNLRCSVMSGNSSVTELPGLDQHPSTYSPFSKGKRLRVQPIRARHDVSYQWRSVWRVQPGIFHLCESLKETKIKNMSNLSRQWYLSC